MGRLSAKFASDEPGSKRSEAEIARERCDALNAIRRRDDVEWIVDSNGVLRTQQSAHVSNFALFMQAAKRRELSHDDIRGAPFSWLKVAAEHGYVRHLGDSRYEARKYTGYESEPPRR